MGKYFKYAIGEIILVVIGILIALQINNWNEASKSKVREQIYLEAILADMQNNIIEIEEDIASNKVVIQSCDSLLLLANNGEYVSITDEQMGNLAMALGNYSKLKLEQGTFEEILSSGALQLFNNEEIRSYIADWDRNFIEIRELEIFAREYQEKYLGLIDQFIPFHKFPFVSTKYTDDIKEVYFNNMEVLNTVFSIRFVAITLNDIYTSKIEEIEGFITRINAELQ